MLPCVHFVYLTLLDHSTPAYVSSVLTNMAHLEYYTVVKSHALGSGVIFCESRALLIWHSFSLNIDRSIVFAFKFTQLIS